MIVVGSCYFLLTLLTPLYDQYIDFCFPLKQKNSKQNVCPTTLSKVTYMCLDNVNSLTGAVSKTYLGLNPRFSYMMYPSCPAEKTC